MPFPGIARLPAEPATAFPGFGARVARTRPAVIKSWFVDMGSPYEERGLLHAETARRDVILPWRAASAAAWASTGIIAQDPRFLWRSAFLKFYPMHSRPCASAIDETGGVRSRHIGLPWKAESPANRQKDEYELKAAREPVGRRRRVELARFLAAQ